MLKSRFLLYIIIKIISTCNFLLLCKFCKKYESKKIEAIIKKDYFSLKIIIRTSHFMIVFKLITYCNNNISRSS